MKAIEAAEHSDVIFNTKSHRFFAKHADDNEWWSPERETVDLAELIDLNYVPLVPKKIYKIGDKVTFLEALNSGMCFEAEDYGLILRWRDEQLDFYDQENKRWDRSNWQVNFFRQRSCTLCEDPSIPPKPTLAEIPAWTRCKVKPANYTVGICDVIKKPGGSFEYYDSGNGFGFVNVELIAVYDAKTEQWEDV